MISVRLCSREEVETRLGKLGCKPTGTVLKTAELWVTRKGHYFFVPCEGPDKRCDELTLNAIEDEIRELGHDR